MAHMAMYLGEIVKARVRECRNAGERMPGLIRDFVALAGGLRVVTESHAASVFRVRQMLKTFTDELSLIAIQIYGACSSADNAFLDFRPEQDETRAARNLEEQTLAFELEYFPDRFVRFLVRSNFLVQTQCERQIQCCVNLLDNIERVTNYEPLIHMRDAFAEISVAVMVAQMSSRIPPQHQATLHVRRVIQSDTGGDATPIGMQEEETTD